MIVCVFLCLCLAHVLADVLVPNWVFFGNNSYITTIQFNEASVTSGSTAQIAEKNRKHASNDTSALSLGG